MLVGIVATGVGVEWAVRSAERPAMDAWPHRVLCGGVVFFIAAVTAIRLASGRCRLLRLRLAVMAFVGGLGAAAGLLAPPVLVPAVLVALVAVIVAESRADESVPERASAEEEAPACSHAEGLPQVAPNAEGCEECLAGNLKWVHLRLCRTCGHVGCCDSSEFKHATAHHRATGHPVIASLEPGESWSWCYVDETYV
jgi:hypothetical protein